MMELTAFVRALSPNRPLKADDPRYVERPENGGDHLARIAALDPDPIAIFGPSGVGKSTELIRAARRLESEATPILVQLDRMIDMSRLTLDAVFTACADAVDAGTWPADLAGLDLKRAARLARPPVDGLLDLLRTRFGEGRPVLLIDGLEKAEEQAARAALNGLLRLAPEAGLVVVVPPSLVIGPAAYRAVEHYRQYAIGPLPTDAARPFFQAVLARRLAGATPPSDVVVERALTESGGIARTFLSLLKSAGLYAALADRETIAESDLRDAVEEHREAMARVLAGGDLQRLARLVDGGELDVLTTEARARLVSHGVLLRSDADLAHPGIVHPLLRDRVQWTVDALGSTRLDQPMRTTPMG